MVLPITGREALQLAVATLSTSSVGCLSRAVNQSTATPDSQTELRSSPTSPSDTPNDIGAAPASNCPDGYTADFDPWWTVVGSGPLDGFELSLDKGTYAVGEQLVAKLRNVTEEEKNSSHESKVDIQHYGSNGWHTIFGASDEPRGVFPAVAEVHQPNEGYTWEVTLSKSALVEEGGDIAWFLHPCRKIDPGNYRFVYWGIGDRGEALGVPFNVLQE